MGTDEIDVALIFDFDIFDYDFLVFSLCFDLPTFTFADCFSQSNLNFGSAEFSRQENVNKQIPFISEFMNFNLLDEFSITFAIAIELVEIKFYSWRFLKSLFCDQCSKSNPFS